MEHLGVYIRKITTEQTTWARPVDTTTKCNNGNLIKRQVRKQQHRLQHSIPLHNLASTARNKG